MNFVITGASSGIGRSIAIELAKKYKLSQFTLISRSSTPPKPDEYGEEPTYKIINEKTTSSAEQLFYDFSSVEGIPQLVKSIKERFYKVDVLVNNAGILPLKSFFEIEQHEYFKLLNVNLNSVFFLTREIVKSYPDIKNIINIASVSGLTANPDDVAYGMTKAAIINFTKSLAKLLAPKTRVNCISPGFIKTNLVPGETPKELIEQIPLKYEASPKVIAKAVIFILENEYVNGSNIVVDGGLIA